MWRVEVHQSFRHWLRQCRGHGASGPENAKTPHLPWRQSAGSGVILAETGLRQVTAIPCIKRRLICTSGC